MKIVINKQYDALGWDGGGENTQPPKQPLLNYKEVSDEVLTEVYRAKEMFPNNFVNHHEGYAVLLEEVDELWDEVKKNQRNYDNDKFRKEAIQVAAMAIRFAAELTTKHINNIDFKK